MTTRGLITTYDFSIGDRVRLHPATSAWMQGDRFGNVVDFGRKYVHVKCDSGRVRKIAPANLERVS